MELAETRALVERLRTDSDLEAFSAIVNHYADLVYSTCHRILGDESRAADAAQDTFIHLFRCPERIENHLGGWLHRVATRRCVDMLRSDAARKRREEAYVHSIAQCTHSWAEVEPLVDAALDRLPEELRELLTQCYLEKKTMGKIAAEKGISQPTVSRRIVTGLNLVRSYLRENGVKVGLVPLHCMLLHGKDAAQDSLAAQALKSVAAKMLSLWAETGKLPALLSPYAIKLSLATFAAAIGVYMLGNAVEGEFARTDTRFTSYAATNPVSSRAWVMGPDGTLHWRGFASTPQVPATVQSAAGVSQSTNLSIRLNPMDGASRAQAASLDMRARLGLPPQTNYSTGSQHFAGSFVKSVSIMPSEPLPMQDLLFMADPRPSQTLVAATNNILEPVKRNASAAPLPSGFNRK